MKLGFVTALAFGSCAFTAFAAPTADMQAVLDALADLKAQPVHTLDVAGARSEASPADAAKMVQWQNSIPGAPESKVATRDIAIPTPAGALPARLYIPEGTGPFPVIVYFHGGGWVIADLNTYDATPRSLTTATNAITVSVEYRHAPEFPFPAAHEDAWAAYRWTVENIHRYNGDSARETTWRRRPTRKMPTPNPLAGPTWSGSSRMSLPILRRPLTSA